MSKPQPFVVPAGVTFQITDAGVVIENEGDIVLHTNFGRSLTRIVSTAGSVTIHAPVDGGAVHAAGDVSVHGDVTLAELHAGGQVSVTGSASVALIAAGGSVHVAGDATSDKLDVGGDLAVEGALSVGGVRAGGQIAVNGAAKADTLHANTMRFAGATLTARGIQAASAVHIGAAKLQVDAILAPEVHLDPGTNGRVTVIESRNEFGPNAIKGGFRLVDYGEMFGDSEGFLAERGLSPLGGALPAPAAPATSVATPTAPASEAAPSEEPAAPVPPVQLAAEQEIEAAAPEPVEAEAEPADAEPVDAEPEEIEAVAEEAEPAVSMEAEEEEPAAPEHPLHEQLVEAVTRITESYADAELPPAVNHLLSLIETRSYDQVRAEITTIWSDLLKFHQKKGLRIQHQVTTTFNTINSLVKKI